MKSQTLKLLKLTIGCSVGDYCSVSVGSCCFSGFFESLTSLRDEMNECNGCLLNRWHSFLIGNDWRCLLLYRGCQASSSALCVFIECANTAIEICHSGRPT